LAEHEGEEEEGSAPNQDSPPNGFRGRLFSLAPSKSVWGKDDQMVTNARSRSLPGGVQGREPSILASHHQ